MADGQPFNPKFRKRRKFQGSAWTPPSMSADAKDGEYCRACRKFHGYMSMGMSMEPMSGGEGRFRQLWSCPKTGDVIKEIILGKKKSDESDDASEGESNA